jgi:prepilin-type N-terminal cleavage/methylation domain-containing protein
LIHNGHLGYKSSQIYEHKEFFMKRTGFTMIELIFVIVILGILAAVALPKFIGVASQAQVGKLSAFVGTLNRTVGPSMWSMSVTNRDNGSLFSPGVTSAVNYDTVFVQQIETPTGLGDTPAQDLLPPTPSTCSPYVAAPAAGWTDAQIQGWNSALPNQVVIGAKIYDIVCMDGSATEAPHFALNNVTDGVLVVR